MSPLLFGDRAAFHREGARRFLAVLDQALAYDGVPAWQEAIRAAEHRLAGNATLDAAAQALTGSLREARRAEHTAPQQLQPRERELEHLRSDLASCRHLLRALQEATSTARLGVLEERVRTLQEELAAARTRLESQALALKAERRTVAAHEATITELNAIIAKQHHEFDALFGALDELD